jgi:tRNA threonylcarbamoyladenosine biosynthesis protein TsaB
VKLLLALETATEDASVALLEGEGVVCERELPRGREHAASVLVAVDALLAAAGETLDHVDRIALSIGPGSFTGLRVGLATALGLCFGTERRIVPVPTLSALSLHAEGYELRVPLLDARRGEVYAGLYDDAAHPLRDDCVTRAEPWLESLRGRGRIAFLGSGARLARAAIERILGRDAVLLPEAAGLPRAGSVGRLARALGALEPAAVELRYLRAPEAEVVRTRV